jgi:hypothetical protein
MPFPCKNNFFADGRTSGPDAEPTVSDERYGFAQPVYTNNSVHR